MPFSRIRASVEISRPAVTVESYGVGGVVSAAKPVINVAFVLPLADVRWITVTYGAELDFRGLNKLPKEFQFVVDAAVVSVTKVRADSVGTSDVHTLLVVKKNPNDPVHTAELRTYTYQKPLADLVDATDDLFGLADADDQQTMFMSKSLPVESQHVSDVQHSSFAKPFSEPKAVVDVRTAAVGKARSDSTVTTEVRTVTFAKPLHDVVDAGDELNGSFVTDDGQVMFLVKPFADSFVTGDIVANEAGKVSDDGITQSDYLWPFDLGKGIIDTPTTSDPHTFDTTKPIEDSTTNADFAAVGFATGFADRTKGFTEGPNSFFDYFAQDYDVEDYVATGIPAFGFEKARTDAASTGDQTVNAFGKLLSDTVVSTDDFHGEANSDDDQTMSFVKNVADTGTTGESQVFAVGLTKADVADFADALTELFGKSVADSFTKSDFVSQTTGKVLADSASWVDNSARYVNKYLSDVVDATDDFYGAANADDDQTMSFVTGRADTVSKSDAASVGAGKNLTDTTQTGHSGYFRMTDYCDVLYFTSDYVGTASTF